MGSHDLHSTACVEIDKKFDLLQVPKFKKIVYLTVPFCCVTRRIRILISLSSFRLPVLFDLMNRSTHAKAGCHRHRFGVVTEPYKGRSSWFRIKKPSADIIVIPQFMDYPIYCVQQSFRHKRSSGTYLVTLSILFQCTIQLTVSKYLEREFNFKVHVNQRHVALYGTDILKDAKFFILVQSSMSTDVK